MPNVYEQSTTPPESGKEKREERFVEVTAKEFAQREDLKEPEDRHFDQARVEIAALEQQLGAELLDKLLGNAIKAQDFRERAGEEAFGVYKEVSEALQLEFQSQLEEALTLYVERFENTRQGTKREEEELTNELKTTVFKKTEELDQKMNQKLYSDPRVIAAFEGKEDVLEDFKDFSLNEAMDAMKAMFEFVFEVS